MDLEVVGRHALLFDDDTTAAFVNSTAALVEWNSLLIDRYDVRHFLSAPPPRSKRRPTNPDEFSSLESELDRERYLDLPPDAPSPSDQQDLDDGAEPVNAGGYNAVPFAYGNSVEATDEKNADVEPGFRPPFAVPESFLPNLPPTEKLHQIIARTAMFVSNHGGQSEIVLRVKQGDNPTFGFLMPDHPLHAYYRFLVDHRELLSGKSVEGKGKAAVESGKTGDVGGAGALSLLGSVYGNGEDEDITTETAPEHKRNGSVEAVDGVYCIGSELVESTMNVTEKDEAVSKHLVPSSKDKASIRKRNHSVSTVKIGTGSMKKGGDSLHLIPPTDKSQSSSLPSASKIELPVVEPPSDLKRVIDKIVEFILKNGKEFEAVLAEQDVKHGRFPFLLPSNLYHPYYRNVLQKAEESKVPGKGSMSEKQDKKAVVSRETNSLSLGSDIPYDSDRKEKFKMVIGKPKKDGQEPPARVTQPQIGVNVDAAAAAAILQAATRGIKNPNLEILAKTSLNGSCQGLSSEGVEASSFGPQSSMKKQDQSEEPGVSVPVANAIAKTAAIAAAGEADSSEAGLSKEQKLKAERLKRAKMFAAMIKSGAAPLKTEPLRGLSVEPPESGPSGSNANVVDVAGEDREGSSVPIDFHAFNNNDEAGKKHSGDDHNERRSKRKYRSRSDRYEEDDEEEDEDAEEERNHKHSRKRRHSRHSSHNSRDRHKHRKRGSSSKDRDSQHQHKHDNSSDNEHGYSQDRHNHDLSSIDEHQHSRHRSKHDSSSDDEHLRSKHRHRHEKCSDNEHRHSRHHHKRHSSTNKENERKSSSSSRRKRSHLEREADLEEGEICSKSDQSKASNGNAASREASVEISKSYPDRRAPSQPSDTTEISDDLRAKIRAMLIATL